MNKDLNQLKKVIITEIDQRRKQLGELSRNIHANPELGFEEVKAVAWLTKHLQENGFSITEGIAGLPTAFSAGYGQGKPIIALLAEYDALPELGHACGHNLIATAAVGGGIAARKAIDRFGGSIWVIGTPGEEIQGGKAIMVEQGAFDSVDIAMMVHPGVQNTVTTRALACQSLQVEFFGKAAHAAANPEAGINALDAILLSFAAINSLRQHIKTSARIHGVITDGGEAANIIPAHSAAIFLVRTEEEAYLEEVKQKVLNCFTSAATATGARLEYRWGKVKYAPMRNNLTLARLFRQNMQALGRQVKQPRARYAFGSTDMGNVSQRLPSIHPFVAIAPEEVLVHSPQFAAAAASAAGTKGTLDSAKALAMTVADLVASPQVVSRIKSEFGPKR